MDAPSLVILLIGLAFAATFAGIFVGSPAGLHWSAVFWLVAVLVGAVAAAMVHSSVRGKARLWTQVLDGLELRGDEQVLDAGCGRGLVLLSLARRLPAGHATGVDVWRNRDQSGNSRAATVLNAEIAGVAERVTVRDGDVRHLPLEDDTFDVVTAGFVLHNLPSAADRATAVAELLRVTRPSGRVVIVDIARTGELAAALRAAGAEGVDRSGRRWLTCPPARVVTTSCRPASPGASAGSRR